MPMGGGVEVKMETQEMIMEFDSSSSNESFARVAVAAFAARLDPTVEENTDIKTAVSEAVTNCIIHGYESEEGKIRVECKIQGRDLFITVMDRGCGIADVEKAMEPLYTSRPELERSGMGFAFMQAFMDEIRVSSIPMAGTVVQMRKKIAERPEMV